MTRSVVVPFYNGGDAKIHGHDVEITNLRQTSNICVSRVLGTPLITRDDRIEKPPVIKTKPFNGYQHQNNRSSVHSPLDPVHYRKKVWNPGEPLPGTFCSSGHKTGWYGLSTIGNSHLLRSMLLSPVDFWCWGGSLVMDCVRPPWNHSFVHKYNPELSRQSRGGGSWGFSGPNDKKINAGVKMDIWHSVSTTDGRAKHGQMQEAGAGSSQGFHFNHRGLNEVKCKDVQNR